LESEVKTHPILVFGCECGIDWGEWTSGSHLETETTKERYGKTKERDFASEIALLLKGATVV
jgi:hypothetical protein